MKVLYVCYANAGRSQMAKALYNYWSESNNADSAGTGVADVSPECKTLGQLEKQSGHIASSTIVMKSKFGVDIASSERKQLLPEMLSSYDLVVNIADRDQTPDWFRGDRVIWWYVPDLGPKFSDEQVWQNFDRISDKVRKLIDLDTSGGNLHTLDDNIDTEDVSG